MNSLLRIQNKLQTSQSFSKTASLAGIGSIVLGIVAAGGFPFLLLGIAVAATVLSLCTGQSTDQILNRFSDSAGGMRNVFLFLAVALSVSILLHGGPAHALFDGAKRAASDGIGQYVGENEAVSIITTITFGMWTFAAVGGIAILAGGTLQNIMVLVGGLTLFFGMIVLIMVLEFSDRLIFALPKAGPAF